jgi:hypothetical protein
MPMDNVPQTHSPRPKTPPWAYELVRWIGVLALIATLLLYSVLPDLSRGYIDDIGYVWLKSRPVKEWMILRGIELLIVIISILIMLYGSVQEWRLRWLFCLTCPVVFLWIWWIRFA